MDAEIKKGREFLKADWETFEDTITDQNAGKPAPPIEKPFPPNAELISLPEPEEKNTNGISLFQAIGNRKSRRRLESDPLLKEELSFLLWATQGIKGPRSSLTGLRTVPSAGARHCFETYLYVFAGEELKQGLYRYLPIEHALILVSDDPELETTIVKGLFEQRFGASTVFIWTAIPYRTEWRYAYVAHKVIAFDAGHVCQNLYLACEAIGCGTCAVGAYDQTILDSALGVDGENEFVIYSAPVGKI